MPKVDCYFEVFDEEWADGISVWRGLEGIGCPAGHCSAAALPAWNAVIAVVVLVLVVAVRLSPVYLR